MAGMKLKDYLDQNNIDRSEFAELMDVTPECVGYWLNGRRKPRSEKLIKRLSKVTNGQVGIADFYEAA